MLLPELAVAEYWMLYNGAGTLHRDHDKLNADNYRVTKRIVANAGKIS